MPEYSPVAPVLEQAAAEFAAATANRPRLCPPVPRSGQRADQFAALPISRTGS